MQYNAMQCTEMQCNAMQYKALQCNASAQNVYTIYTVQMYAISCNAMQ